MTENSIVIKLDNVSKRFNVYRRNIERIKCVIFGREPSEVKQALKNVTLNVKEGERIIIFGVADAGRSTLIKVIAGITGQSKGKVCTFGKRLNVMLDYKTGMDVEFTCRDNIYLKANVVGIAKKEIEPFVDEILEFAEVTDFADLPMKRTPKGSVALISLGVHLVYDSDILIVDEVFGGGGLRVFTKCEKKLTEYMNAHPEKTLIVVSNRNGVLRELGTRAIVLDHGQIIYDGTVEEAAELFDKINKRK